MVGESTDQGKDKLQAARRNYISGIASDLAYSCTESLGSTFLGGSGTALQQIDPSGTVKRSVLKNPAALEAFGEGLDLSLFHILRVRNPSTVIKLFDREIEAAFPGNKEVAQRIDSAILGGLEGVLEEKKRILSDYNPRKVKKKEREYFERALQEKEEAEKLKSLIEQRNR